MLKTYNNGIKAIQSTKSTPLQTSEVLTPKNVKQLAGGSSITNVNIC